MSGAPGRSRIPKVRTLRTPDALRSHLDAIGVELGFDETVTHGPDSPLGHPAVVAGRRLGNRLAILPMEGWDGTRDGGATELVERRWRRFGQSGAKLIWGGEAVAVRPEGRANPNQMVSCDATTRDLERLREALVIEHVRHSGSSDDLVVGLQLTHSGRWARPDGEARPRVGYRHPLLDARVGVVSDDAVLSDGELDDLVGEFAAAARRAREAGFDFVDVKHCHGYLLHELLGARQRAGRYGGSFEGRTRFVREAVAAIGREAPGLAIGVRLSIFDFAPYRPGPDGIGIAEEGVVHPAFGGDGTGEGIDLEEPQRFLDLLEALGIELVCTTAGSPYYNPHIQRPAYFPPSDGYLPPEDPLAGVARQIEATAALKAGASKLFVVGSGYSYLQEWLPAVAQHQVRTGRVDSVGYGRMVLSYPALARDILEGRELDRKLICRTFSDCTTAPRGGLVSGCYPIDDFYKDRPEAEALRTLKARAPRR